MIRRARLFLLQMLFMARVAVPAGFMLAPGGAAALVPCPVMVEVSAAQGADHAMSADGEHSASTEHGDGSPTPGKTPCPFTAMAAPASLPDVPVEIGLTVPIVASPIAARPALPVARRLAAPPPPARGPPSA